MPTVTEDQTEVFSVKFTLTESQSPPPCRMFLVRVGPHKKGTRKFPSDSSDPEWWADVYPVVAIRSHTHLMCWKMIRPGTTPDMPAGPQEAVKQGWGLDEPTTDQELITIDDDSGIMNQLERQNEYASARSRRYVVAPWPESEDVKRFEAIVLTMIPRDVDAELTIHGRGDNLIVAVGPVDMPAEVS